MADTPTHEARIVAAARALNKRHAELCNVNEADSWMIQGDDFREDARAALAAADAALSAPADMTACPHDVPHRWPCPECDAPQPTPAALSVQAEPAADKWEGAEEWMPLAWELCADECGEDACTELVWEGGPVPEPWGDRWLKYEGEAKRLIALVRKHVPGAAPQPPAPVPAPSVGAEGLPPLPEHMDGESIYSGAEMRAYALAALASRPAVEADKRDAESLTEPQFLALIRAVCNGDTIRLTRDVGPYEVTEVTPDALRLFRAIERAARHPAQRENT